MAAIRKSKIIHEMITRPGSMHKYRVLGADALR